MSNYLVIGQAATAAAASAIDPLDHFDIDLYTGTGATGNERSNFAFQPDVTWFHRRTGTADPSIHDSARGRAYTSYTSKNSAEGTGSSTQDVESFDADGFTVGSPWNTNSANPSGATIVNWSWKMGGSASSNTDGSITTNCSANTDAGQSLFTYTGNGTAGATIGHGLSSTPDVVWIKRRAAATSWAVWAPGLTGPSYELNLDTNGNESDISTVWNSTAPNSSVITCGTSSQTNGSSQTYVGMAWHSVSGYSKFGWYTGNGSTSGPSITGLGATGRAIIIKAITNSGNWYVIDSDRGNNYVLIDTTAAESSGTYVSFTSDGADIVTDIAGINQNTIKYAYMLFA